MFVIISETFIFEGQYNDFKFLEHICYFYFYHLVGVSLLALTIAVENSQVTLTVFLLSILKFAFPPKSQ